MTVLSRPEFVDIDRHFASFIGRFGGDRDVDVSGGGRAQPRDREMGILVFHSPQLRALSGEAEVADSLAWPTASEWRSVLAKSKAVGGPGDQTPLIVDDSHRLYLRRYWNYEQRLAGLLAEKASSNPPSSKAEAGTRAGAIRRSGEE